MLRSRPVLATNGWILEARAQDVTRYVLRGAELVERAVERAGARVRELSARLRTLSPQSTLDRGYAIVQSGGHVVKSADAAPEGAALLVTLAEGSIGAVSSGSHTAL